MKYVSFLAIIVFIHSEGMQKPGTIPVLKLGVCKVVNGKAISGSPRETSSPRQTSAHSSPRKSLKELKESGEKIVHPALVRAISERQLLDLKNQEGALRELNNADKRMIRSPKITKSGSNSPLSARTQNYETEHEIEQSQGIQSPFIVTRRNTISS